MEYGCLAHWVDTEWMGVRIWAFCGTKTRVFTEQTAVD